MEQTTSDIVLAASLIVSGFKLTGIQLVGTKGVFCFAESPLDEIIAFLGVYSLGNARVEPKAFNNKIRELTTSVRQLSGKPRL